MNNWRGCGMTDEEIKISLNLPQDLVRRIDKLADDEHRSRTRQIEHILREWLDDKR